MKSAIDWVSEIDDSKIDGVLYLRGFIQQIQSDARKSALTEAADIVDKIHNPFDTNRDKNEGFKIMRSKSSQALRDAAQLNNVR
jgi:hypothetical protein